MTQQTRRNIEAFSLVELSIVITVASVIAGSALVLAKTYIQTERYEETAQKMEKIEYALAHYVEKNGFLPCPAPSNQPRNSATFGVASNCAAFAPSGTTDLNGSRVRRGVLPVRELNLHDTYLYDDLNNEFIYTVVKNLATTDTAFENYTKPVSYPIDVRDRNGNSLLNTSSMVIAYVLYSDGQVTYSNGLTRENKDNDAIFIDTKLNTEFKTAEGFIGFGLGSSPENPHFFDDIMAWKPKYLLDPNN